MTAHPLPTETQPEPAKPRTFKLTLAEASYLRKRLVERVYMAHTVANNHRESDATRKVYCDELAMIEKIDAIFAEGGAQ